MNEIIPLLLTSAAFGILGALIRIVFMSLKLDNLKKSISHSGFWLYTLVVISIGAFSGIILSLFSYPGSILGGYAGLDLIETYSNTIKKAKVSLKK